MVDTTSEYEALMEEASPQPNRFRKLAAVATGLLLFAGCAGTMMHAKRASGNAPKPSLLAADTSICELDPSQNQAMATYCAVNSLDKVLVADADCSAFYYAFDGHDVDAAGVNSCASGGFDGCHVEDRGGSACFSCGIPDFESSSGDTDDWGLYCAASTPKQWFMTGDCSAAIWSIGDNANPDGTMLYSYNGFRCPDTGAVGDMRDKMWGCLQYESEWCWATSIIIVAGFYDPATYPNHDSTGPNCRGETCQVVGAAHSPDDPNAPCEDKDSFNQPGTGADMTNMLSKFTGTEWAFIPGIEEELLVQVLQDSNPVIYGIAYPDGGGHVMVIAGTDGNGMFYLFDPFFVHGRGSFQSLTYDGLVNYQTPGYTGEDPSFGSGTMNQAYVPSQYATVLQLSASEMLAPQVLASRLPKKEGFMSIAHITKIKPNVNFI